MALSCRGHLASLQLESSTPSLANQELGRRNCQSTQSPSYYNYCTSSPSCCERPQTCEARPPKRGQVGRLLPKASSDKKHTNQRRFAVHPIAEPCTSQNPRPRAVVIHEADLCWANYSDPTRVWRPEPGNPVRSSGFAGQSVNCDPMGNADTPRREFSRGRSPSPTHRRRAARRQLTRLRQGFGGQAAAARQLKEEGGWSPSGSRGRTYAAGAGTKAALRPHL